MANPFDSIADWMCKVIHWINAPCIACAVMMCMGNTINDWVTHIDIWRRHVNFSTQHFRTVREFTVFHRFKQCQVFFHTAVAIWAFFARFCQCAAIFAHFFGCQITYKSFAVFDQLHGTFIEFWEIIGRIAFFALPVEAQPFYIGFDRIYIFCIFFHRIGIIKTQVAFAVVALCQAKIQADGFGMSHMQIAVWFRRESGVYFFRSIGDIFINNCLNKVGCACNAHNVPSCI